MGSRQENRPSQKVMFRLFGILLVLSVSGFVRPLYAVTVTYVSTAFVLEKTSSDRIVVGSNDILHVVYVEGDSPGSTPIIKYTWSNSQGATWSTPQALASGIAPSLAIDDNGVLSLAYVGPPYGSATEPQYGAIYYMRKSPDGSNSLPWSSPVKIIENGASPSLTGFEGNMHLAWADYIVKYASFPTATPPAIPLAAGEGESIEPILLCGGTYRVSVPSLAVAPRGPGQPPIVRVAFYRSYDTRSTPFSCGGALTAGVYIYDRPLDSSSPYWPYWFPLLQDGSSTTDPAFGNYGRVSVSLTANRISSSFFAFYSDVWNGDRVRLARISASGAASISDFLGETGGVRALTDITAIGAPDGDSFKIGYTPLTASHGNTFVRSSLWGPSAGAPSLGPAVQKSSQGRNANVVYFDRATTNGTKGINALYEEKASETSYRLDVDYFQPPVTYPSCWNYEGMRCSAYGRIKACTDDFGEQKTCRCWPTGSTDELRWVCLY